MLFLLSTVNNTSLVYKLMAFGSIVLRVMQFTTSVMFIWVGPHLAGDRTKIGRWFPWSFPEVTPWEMSAVPRPAHCHSPPSPPSDRGVVLLHKPQCLWILHLLTSACLDKGFTVYGGTMLTSYAIPPCLSDVGCKFTGHGHCAQH